MEDPEGAVRAALRNPIGTPPLSEVVGRGERVAIVVNDITRLVHSEVFLPVLINELNSAGIRDSDIFIVFALGIHRRQSPDEQHLVVGEEVARERLRAVRGGDGLGPERQRGGQDGQPLGGSKACLW